MRTIAVVGTLDTKGAEHAYVAMCIRQAGHQALLIDIGTQEQPTVQPDISSADVLNRVGQTIADVNQADRGQAISRMAAALPVLIRDLADQGRIHGIISLGGSGGTALATAAMRALPLGFPKVMVTTMASGNVAQYVDVSDIVMIPSIVDVSGLNRISRGVFVRAAAAVLSMAEANTRPLPSADSKPLIVASMFGNTTRCVEQAKKILEDNGFEVIVFHATGVGGRAMEALIETGMVAGVLDVTTTEWADQIVGGVMPGGSHRLEAAARAGVPAVIAPGCLDMVNFGPPESVPERYKGRLLYQHNPQVTLLRTTLEECALIAEAIAKRINLSVGPVHVLFPLRAISVISRPGQPFHDPVADQALLSVWKRCLRQDIPVEEIDCEINDSEFATRCALRLIEAIQTKSSTCPTATA